MAVTIDINLNTPRRGGGGRGRSGGGGGGGGSDDDDLPEADEIDEEKEFLQRLRKQLALDNLLKRGRKAGYLPSTDEDLPFAKEVNEETERRRRQQEQQMEEMRRREQIGFYGAAAQRTVAAGGMLAAGTAQNRVGPGLNAAVDTAAMGLARLGPVGMVAAAGLKVVGEAAGALQQTIMAFVQRGRELAGLNGGLARATARADANNYLADFREAERLGPSLAKLIENQNKAELAQRELLLPIKDFLIKSLNVILEDGLNTLVTILEVLNKLPGIAGELTDKVNRIKDIIAGNTGGDPIAVWLSSLSNFSSAGIPGRPAPAGAIGTPFRVMPTP